MAQTEVDQLESAVADFLSAYFIQQKFDSVHGCDKAVDALVRALKEYREAKEVTNAGAEIG